MLALRGAIRFTNALLWVAAWLGMRGGPGAVQALATLTRRPVDWVLHPLAASVSYWRRVALDSGGLRLVLLAQAVLLAMLWSRWWPWPALSVVFELAVGAVLGLMLERMERRPPGA